jgi:hypothetical protein
LLADRISVAVRFANINKKGEGARGCGLLGHLLLGLVAREIREMSGYGTRSMDSPEKSPLLDALAKVGPSKLLM